MGCCGGGAASSPAASNVMRQTGSPVVTGYALDMPDGRVITYLTRAEADAAHETFGLQTPVREVLGWR